ncbi:hypothetical protein CHLRE_15g643390v5 [Chlamydomonas reinhardtii]|uniref:Uncharacterized protein n=1 Tax=Chlamydomonas reinhardtii TaxID=3055 RepID=A0A2K3CX04_CHLRE|nr:uncharacterized protein CHLRE_21g751847v5 [Chlamydomonas reinhardtii]XP_042916576.1 uncharacterized protein CHLRE_15g643390v5 [Chlamydomonas reinhardtii]PNW69744.1 hypothetical protein CHLRE_21g751847v5 [Chlamydomonas reinhardtii]PNW72817.1 hypothetical protein CHLRE_15g643390v5 [Chlamydomonas reinhardtii]
MWLRVATAWSCRVSQHCLALWEVTPREVGCKCLVLLCFFVLLGGVVRVGGVSCFDDVDGVAFAGKHDKVWV